MSDDWVDIRKDEAHVARERAKAQALKRTPWWREQLRKGVCHYCGKTVGAEHLTMDHVIPVARGGRSVQSNVVPCCEACNQAKQCQTPAEQILAGLEEQGGLPPLDDADLERYLDPDNWGK